MTRKMRTAGARVLPDLIERGLGAALTVCGGKDMLRHDR
jgi:hypothetical protein